ncbi:MAG TPA: DNA primase [Microthrixaceae bacterium]|nr:DNA primase [Microthrixaceae bacterium]
MGIVDEDIVKVRETTDIVALISGYTPLKRVGQRWSGLCPFHTEKSASFSVDSTSGLYHCFGCKASGDAITFVREKEQLDFVGAIEFLAGKAGVVLRYTDHDEGASRKRLNKLYDQVERAAEWYHERLRTSPDAAAARSYLRGRGFTADEVAHYRVGWAPDGWDTMARALKISKADLTATGLGFENKAGRAQDFFRARVLFPIIDERNRVIGFGGRKLPDADGPKYQNSRDNELYHKSRAVYGLNWAKADAVNAGEIIICEGYTDVIGFARAGLTRAIATCGTALTEEHVKLIKRFSTRLVLAYDADDAGQSAADRVYAWEKSYGIEVAVVDLPVGSDPDELARSSPETLRQAVTGAKPFLQFRVDRVLGASQLRGPEERSRAAETALEVVAEHPDGFVRDLYLMQIADTCRIDVELLRTRLQEVLRSPRPKASGVTSAQRNREAKGGANTRRGTQGGSSGYSDEPLPEEFPGGSESEWSEEPTDGFRSASRSAPNGGSRASNRNEVPGGVEAEALKMLIQHQEHVDQYLATEFFSHPTVREAYMLVSNSESLTEAIDQASPDVAQLLARLAVEQSEAEATDVLTRLATEVGRDVMAELESEARSSADPLSYAASITWLKLALDDLRSPRAEVEKLTQLLVWLRDRRRDSDWG